MAAEAFPGAIQAGVDVALSAEMVGFAGVVGGIALSIAQVRSARLVNARNEFSQQHIDQISGFANATVEYAHNEGIGAIVLIDGAGRPFYKPLISAWREHYDHKTDPRPPIFFLNPQGFRDRSGSVLQASVGSILKPLIRGGRLEMPGKRRSHQEITESFAREHSWLFQLRDRPLLLIDGCLHSGRSAAPVLASLGEVGFSDVRLEVGSYSHSSAPYAACTPDIILSKTTPLGGCYPFGLDKMTEKTYAMSTSQPTSSRGRRRMAVHLRRNLRTHFETAVASDSN